jgi:hypothetical protein
MKEARRSERRIGGIYVLPFLVLCSLGPGLPAGEYPSWTRGATADSSPSPLFLCALAGQRAPPALWPLGAAASEPRAHDASSPSRALVDTVTGCHRPGRWEMEPRVRA